MDKYLFMFQKGFETILKKEMTFPESKKEGNDLATVHGKVTLFAFNDKLFKWQYMGEFFGNMTATDSFGCRCKISNDFKSLIELN